MRVSARILAALLMVAGALVVPLLPRSAAAGQVPLAVDCYAVKKMGLMEMFDLVDDLDQQASEGYHIDTSVYGPVLATGAQISSADRTAVENTLNAFIACVNERDVRRLVTLLSNRYQARLVLDLLSGGDATSVIADRFPTIIKADNAGDPIATPDIQRAWRPSTNPDQIWTVVSGPIPGYDGDVELFVAFVPSESGWAIDLIASYSE